MKALVGSVVHCELVGCMLPEAESLRPKVHVADGEWLAEVCEKVVGVPAVGEGAAVVGHRPISTLLPFSGRPTLGRPMGSETHQQTDPPAADHPHAFISSLTTHSQWRLFSGQLWVRHHQRLVEQAVLGVDKHEPSSHLEVTGGLEQPQQ